MPRTCPRKKEHRMQLMALADLLAQQQQTGRPYLEFLREPSLSVGLYALPAGGVDGQQPHTEDEVYYIVSGHAAIQVADESRPVGPGSVVFVAAGVRHHFHSITEDLTILVFFAPAEGSRAS
jgi:mannose-6-phosphate isomerase-like protein (cupin superfamily)